MQIELGRPGGKQQKYQNQKIILPTGYPGNPQPCRVRSSRVAVRWISNTIKSQLNAIESQSNMIEPKSNAIERNISIERNRTNRIIT